MQENVLKYHIARIVLALILLFTLAACGGDDDDNDTAPTATTSTTDTTDDSATDTDTDTSPSIPTGTGNYAVSITGDVESALEGGTAVFTYFDGAGVTTESNEVYIFAGSVADEFEQITFSFPVDLEPGTYDLVSETDAILGGDESPVTASYEMFMSGETVAESTNVSFSENVGGTLTIDSIGDTISGSFEFTADAVDFAEDGSQTTQSITASGSFTDLDYVRED
jgi:hypothetical protein